MKSPVLSGLLAGLPLAALFGVYMLVRGKAFVAMLKSSDASMAAMPDRALSLMTLGGFVFAGLFFGVIAGWVYGKVGSPGRFLAVALGLAVLLSVLALVSRTPMRGDKVIMNLAVGFVLGVLVPLLSGG